MSEAIPVDKNEADLVVRLRAALPEAINPWTFSRQTFLKTVVEHAADEIERLRLSLTASEQRVKELEQQIDDAAFARMTGDTT